MFWRRHDDELAEAVERLAEAFERYVAFLLRAATSFTISQEASQMGQINGVSAGSKGTFVASPTPAGSLLQPGAVPAWTVDSTDVTLTPSADGLTVVAAVSPSITAKSFTLTISGTSSSGASISGSATVPVLASAGQAATGFDIAQTS